jgi:hypothetical protein
MDMLRQSSTLPAKKRLGSNKFVLGFAALAATAVVSASGIAAAQTNTVGSGYGNTAINVNVGVSGSNNVIHIILNILK